MKSVVWGVAVGRDAKAGQPLTWTMTVGNADAQSAAGATFDLEVPAGILELKASCTQEANGAQCPTDIAVATPGRVVGLGESGHVRGTVPVLPRGSYEKPPSVTITVTGVYPAASTVIVMPVSVPSPSSTTPTPSPSPSATTPAPTPSATPTTPLHLSGAVYPGGYPDGSHPGALRLVDPGSDTDRTRNEWNPRRIGLVRASDHLGNPGTSLTPTPGSDQPDGTRGCA